MRCLCFGVGALQAYSVSEVWGESCPCSAEERCLAGSSSDPRRCLCFVFFGFFFSPGSGSHLRVELTCRGGCFPVFACVCMKLDMQALDLA